MTSEKAVRNTSQIGAEREDAAHLANIVAAYPEPDSASRMVPRWFAAFPAPLGVALSDISFPLQVG